MGGPLTTHHQCMEGDPYGAMATSVLAVSTAVNINSISVQYQLILQYDTNVHMRVTASLQMTSKQFLIHLEPTGGQVPQSVGSYVVVRNDQGLSEWSFGASLRSPVEASVCP